MNKIKIGIIGAGYIAGVHAAVLARDERVQLAAVYDAVPVAAEKLAGTHNATAVATPLELLERSDAVYITTPNTQHVSLAITAVEPASTFFAKSHSQRASTTHKECSRKHPTRATSFRWAIIVASHRFMQR